MQNHFDKIDISGVGPAARFGHTVTYIQKGKAIMFGGATGDTGKYCITSDTYQLDLNSKSWKKLDTRGSLPSPRAAHSAVCVEINQIVVYGGATGGGSLASDDLYLLDMRSTDDVGLWNIIQVIGPTPGRRYGHCLTFTKPFLIVFGGNTGQEPVNDCWCLNVEKSPFIWTRFEIKPENPMARVYHSASNCTSGSANGMIVIFGGRSGDQSALNDSWGLRRHRDGRWDWIKAPYKSEKVIPIGRYQHSSMFIYNMLFIIGGRTNTVGETLTIDIYDTETSEWSKYNSLQRFRHSSWLIDNFIYIFGGFELDSPNIPTDSIIKLNILKLLNNNDILLNKYNIHSQKQNKSPQSLSPQINHQDPNQTLKGSQASQQQQQIAS